MEQIVGLKPKCKRSNKNALSSVPTPANGEYILVSSDNSMTSDGQGNFDCYIKGDGTKSAVNLSLIFFNGIVVTKLDNSSYTIVKCNIWQNKWNDVGTAARKTIFIPLTTGKNYKLTALGGSVYYCLLTDDTVVAGAAPAFADGYTDKIQLTVGDSVEIEGTSGYFLWVREDSSLQFSVEESYYKPDAVATRQDLENYATTDDVEAMVEEGTTIVEDYTDKAGVWQINSSKTEGTDYNLTIDSSNRHLASLTFLKKMNGTKFGFLLTGLTHGETYTLAMKYSNTASASANLRKYYDPNNTTAQGNYGGGDLPSGTDRSYSFDFEFDASNPYIGWFCGEFGASGTLTITEFSITKKFTLADLKNMIGGDTKASVDDSGLLANEKYVSHTNRTGVLTLLHYSDIHADGNAATAIKAYYDKYSDYIDDILDTGDDVSYYNSDGIQFLVDAGLGIALRSIGNHDAWTTGDQIISDKTIVYNSMIAPFVADWGVTQPANAASQGLNYWYKDYAASNIRLISLDCLYPTSDQLSWFAQAMADTLNSSNSAYGYTVVVAAHYIPANITGTSALVKYNDKIVTFTEYGLEERIANSHMKIDDAYPTAVDTFINNSGKFAVWLCGHYHSDAVFFPNSHPNIFTIDIDKAGSNASHNEEDHAARTAGTPNEVCANVVGIDVVSGVVKVLRVGLKSDKYLRPINTLTYDYINKVVIENV